VQEGRAIFLNKKEETLKRGNNGSVKENRFMDRTCAPFMCNR